jgi:hypothetical protein
MKSIIKRHGKANVNHWLLAFWTVFYLATFGFTPSVCAVKLPTNFLLNLDLGSDNGLGQGSQKTGFAAVGVTTNDFWNFYDADVSSTQVRNSGTVTNLELSDGTHSPTGVNVSDAPGVWGDNSTDPMYHIYVYPLDGGNDVVTFTNLPTGQYDVLAYSPDGNFDLTAGGTNYGVNTSADLNVSTIPVWTEGVQYARWRNVSVQNGQPLVLTVMNGALSGNALLCGVQIINSSNTPAGPQIINQPTNETVLEGSQATFGVTASGSNLSYQWMFDATNLLVGDTNVTLTLTNVQFAQAGTYAIVVSNAGGSVLSSNAVLTVLTTNSPTNGFLLNLDLGFDNGHGQPSQKEGYAAVGLTTNDFWNFYDCDVSQGVARHSGTVTNLELYDKTPTSVGVNVSDAPGLWGDNSTDPMYEYYVYPLDGGNNVVTFTNLPTGQYDVLAYSPGSSFDLAAGGTDYGVKSSSDPNVTSIPVWTEGVQYARWRSVAVTNGQPLVLTVRVGSSGNALLCGVQIISSSPVSNAPPEIIDQPTNETVLQGSQATFNVTASGNNLSYQWTFDTTNLVGATNVTLTLTNVQMDQAGNYAVEVTNVEGAMLSSNAVLTVLTTNYPANGFLLDVDLGYDNGHGQPSQKTGFAAVGLTVNDFWNFYDCDVSQGVARYSGTVTNLDLSDRTPTPIGVNVSDAPGLWTDNSTDPMYHKYVYPLDGGNDLVTITNLPAGQYDVLAYSPGSIFDLAAGGADYGVKSSSDPNVTSIPVWTEGVQYARWRNISVQNGQPLVLTVQDGTSGNALLCGIQIISTELVESNLDHFTWGSLPSSGFVNTPIPATIQAMNELGGVVSNFDGTVDLSATNDLPIQPQLPITFTNGLWSGLVTVSEPATNVVLQADDLNGHLGDSGAITIAPLPMLGLSTYESYLLIYWPNSASTNFILEASTTFSPPDWIPVTTPPFVFEGQNLEIMPMTSTNEYYRLEYTVP